MDDSWGEYADYNENKMLIVHLEIAHVHAQRALNALYSPSGPKRGLWYRLRLGRAQNALISLHMQELRRMKTDGSGK